MYRRARKALFFLARGEGAGTRPDDERIGDEPDQVTVTNPRSSGWGDV
jgi:hypothetical protein